MPPTSHPLQPSRRFDEEGDVAAVSPRQRVYLRGLPQPAGQHIRFDE